MTGDCGLHRPGPDGEPVAPRLVRVRSTTAFDELTVRLRPGQTPAEFQERLPALGHAFRVGNRLLGPARPDFVDRATVRCPRAGVVVVRFPRTDPLASPVPPFRPTAVDVADLTALPVAGTEDGGVFRLPVLYAHVLTAGATGAGKGSVLWSALSALAPAVRSGLVQAWGIDPKGGMELCMGRSLFARLGHDDGADLAENNDSGDGGAGGKADELVTVAEDAARLVRARAARLAGKVRKHTPTVDEPHVVLIIDEIAFMTAYQPDRALRDRFNKALAVVLSQGRAVAVSVLAFLQDPRKETLPARSLFPIKIGLRLDTRSEVEMVLGEDAHERGARCETIPASLPGTGYVLEDGNPVPRRVRFTHLTDEDVRDLARTFPAPPPPPPAITVAAVEVEEHEAAA